MANSLRSSRWLIWKGFLTSVGGMSRIKRLSAEHASGPGDGPACIGENRSDWISGHGGGGRGAEGAMHGVWANGEMAHGHPTGRVSLARHPFTATGHIKPSRL